MFGLVTCPVLLCTIYIYQPDRTMREWATREVRCRTNTVIKWFQFFHFGYFRPIIFWSVYFQAYLVLREREAAGLEPLSKDFIDPEKLLAHLPSDDELKEAGVVINI